jgi:hypothetical protein
MTAFGQPSEGLRNIRPNLDALLDVKNGNKYVRYAHAIDAFLERHRSRLNPPTADVDSYRTVAGVFFTSIFYAPYAQFYFLSSETNYPVYYGIEAFLYGCLVLSIWYFFRRYGFLPALLATAITAASHAIVSVSYNGYSMQALCLSISAIFLCLLPAIRRPLSWAGVRTFGVGTAIVWLCYTHYISVIAPLLVVAGIGALFGRDAAEDRDPTRSTLARSSLRWAATAAYGSLALLLLVSGSGTAIEFVSGLVANFVHGARNVYLGDQIAPFSFHWLAFLFGAVSQQHLQPFAAEIPFVMVTLRAGIAAGVACFLLGLVCLLRSRHALASERASRRDVLAYCIILLTVASHLYLAQSSLYTQAKGAQNVLVILYAALALPFALVYRDRERRAASGKLGAALAVCLGVFAVTLMIPRLVYTYKLARGHDRATILEPSYFSEARRIRLEDPQALVLFEPRKSGDLYVSIQPFAGGRMMPTRHLALARIVPAVSKERAIASDFIGGGDVAHLWSLSAARNVAGSVPATSFKWSAARVQSAKSLELYLFGDDYERDFGKRQRSADAADTGMFSYLRNAAGMLYLPGGQAANVDVRIAPRESGRYAEMLQEVSRRIANGELERSVRLESDGTLVRLRYDIAASDAPRLIPIARYGGEYWLNVRVDGRDLTQRSASPEKS